MSKKLKTLDDVIDEVNRSVVKKPVHSGWKWENPEIHSFVPIGNVQELYNLARFSVDQLASMRKQAIKKGFAQYNATTGEFEWK